MHKHEMLSWAKDLFPIARSLTGDGVRETLAYFKNINPELQTTAISTGSQVFDWEIPQEWTIRDAWIEHIETGQRFAEFSKHNLHILGYATPIDHEMDLSELAPHIYTQPDQPDRIPYVTSYYRERWGFSMSQNEKDALPPGRYRCYIDSQLFDGELLVTDAILSGKSDQEIAFSSYICHPSMANNELSGPVLLNALLQYIRTHYPDRQYSYRFIMVPETIGSLAYLSTRLEAMQSNTIAGYVLSCVGDERAFSRVESRNANTLADVALSAALRGRPNVKTYSFLERGSDERQYCAPGIDLPFCGFCRSKYGEFPEYHTDADNFDLVTEEGLAGAFDVMTSIIDAFEIGLYPLVATKGEPQLGKRGLYPDISIKGSGDGVRTRMNFLCYSDGTNSLFDISQKTGMSLREALHEAKILSENELISLRTHPK